MQVTLIRHGSTAGNLRAAYIGRTDEELTPEGLRQAQEYADPAVKKVYISTLRRTLQTAQAMFPKAQLVAEADLNEMDFGTFEGKNYADLSPNPDYRAWVEGGCTGACPGGEDRAGFCRRVCAVFERIVRTELEQGAEGAVFTVHGGTVMAIMEKYALPKGGFYDYAVKNCRGYIGQVRIDEKGRLVITDLSEK